ncbi:MAG TPA: hotdog fold thioesterase [Gemmatimonadaceae bacterium]
MTPQEEQELAERVVREMLSRDAFSRRMGMHVVSVAPRSATVRMAVSHELLNGFGVCHGGATFALADSALAFASNTHGQVTVSIENSMTYPKTIVEGDVLTAIAEEESATARLAFYRVTVRRAEGEIVALFRGTVYKTNKPFFEDSK